MLANSLAAAAPRPAEPAVTRITGVVMILMLFKLGAEGNSLFLGSSGTKK